MALNKRSRVITEGDARSANRAMLYPVGFTAADFGKPIVGIAHGHSTMNPCNAGIGSLVEPADTETGAAHDEGGHAAESHGGGSHEEAARQAPAGLAV